MKFGAACDSVIIFMGVVLYFIDFSWVQIIAILIVFRAVCSLIFESELLVGIEGKEEEGIALRGKWRALALLLAIAVGIFILIKSYRGESAPL